MEFKRTKSEKIYQGKIIDLTIDYLQYSSGNQTIREIVEHPGGAVILGMFTNNEILLIQQYRHPIGKEIIELPAGKLEKNEDPMLCAQRELQEETGYTSDNWEKLTSLYTAPGFSNEILHIYLARDLYHHKSGQSLEEGEASIRLLRVPFDQAFAMIDRGEIVDGKTIAGIYLARRKVRVS